MTWKRHPHTYKILERLRAAMSENQLEVTTGDGAHREAAGTPALDASQALGSQAHGDARVQTSDGIHGQPPQGNMNQPAAANANVIQLIITRSTVATGRAYSGRDWKSENHTCNW